MTFSAPGYAARPARSPRGAAALAVLATLVACAPAEEPAPEVADPEPEGVYGQAPAAVNGVRSVVLLRPLGDPEGATTREEPLIDQFGLVFSPERLIVDVGEPMSFENSEAALSHNVQVWPVGATAPILDSDALPTDVIAFTPEPGGYDILCDEHPGMRAFLFATDAPYAVFAEEDGSFELGVVPAGRYSIGVWSVDSRFGPTREIDVGGDPLSVDLLSSAEGPAE